MDDQLKKSMTRYRAPPGLQRRIRHMLQEDAARSPGVLRRWREGWAQWLPASGAFVFGAMLAVGVMTWRDGAIGRDDIEEEVVASHVRSLMANHLTDVASTDRHTVKPWFTGKLDYAPPVVDLAQEGFPLVGGRLDYLRERPVAALVYRKGGHTINVFVLPLGDARARTLKPAVRQGFQLADWDAQGMRFWAVSDIGREEMAQFAAAMRAAL